MKKNKKNMTLKEKIVDNIQVFLSAYAIAFVIRMLLIEAYQIPSQSMVPSLLVKDILMVEKVTMGPRIPIINLKFPGILKAQRNDIVVFVHPAWNNPGVAKELVSILSLYLINLDNTFGNPKNLVKRLVGMPGDKISMTNQIVVINGKPLETKYVTTSRQVIYEQLQKQGYMDFDLYTEKEGGKTRVVQHLAGNNRLYRDEVYQFAEIQVPQKGQTIALTNQNEYYLGLLKLLVERESGKSVMVNGNTLWMDGKQLLEWKINQNYYFCMGDNRDFSEDCRYFGFIAEDRIFGRPLFRYFPFTRIGFNVNETVRGIQKHNFL